MLKAILKTVGIAVGLVIIPVALIIIGITLSIIGPLAGILMIIFLPLILVGVVIGYSSRKDKS